jgi:hypothetical protein
VEAEKITIHRRLNISTTTKGVQTADATFTMDGPVDEVTSEVFWAEAQQYFAEVDAFCPPPKEMK